MAHASHGNHSSHGSHGSHANHSNHQNHGSHGNHSNYSNMKVNDSYTNTGNPKTLTWSDWDDISDGDYIKNSVDKIKELRDNISYLKNNHGKGAWNSSPPDNPAVDLSGVDNTELDGVGVDYVDEIQYDSLRSSLDTLKTHLSGTATGLANKDRGDVIENEDFQTLKNEIDNLASYDVSAQYSNHNSHNNHGNHNNHGSHGNHHNHGNHGSYYN